MRPVTKLLLLLTFASHVEAQTSPVMLRDLPMQAANWPPAWAGLVRAIVPARDTVAANFEDEVLARLPKVLATEPVSADSFRYADLIISATIRHHLSVRQAEPSVEERWPRLYKDLHSQQIRVRQDWLDHFRKTDNIKAALALADQWQPATSKDDPLGQTIVQLWSDQAMAALDKADYSAARGWLSRIDDAFSFTPESLAKALRERAQKFLKDSQTLPDLAAVKSLEEALTLWPRLPDARDSLARRKGTFKTLTVGVRSLPEFLSPATAASESEKQALTLLFDRLYRCDEQPGQGKRYHPLLAAMMTENELVRSIPLRRDVYFPSGERLSVADLRHTAYLMNQPDGAGRSALWRDFLEVPKLTGQPFEVSIKYRRGLFDPLAPLTFWVLPRDFRGRELQRADDADFAKAPVGSGPFRYVGRKVEGDRTFGVFQANPCDLQDGGSKVREIRMVAWSDARKDLPKPLPQLIFEAPTEQLTVLKELGYVEVAPVRSNAVHILAVNHRKASLAQVAVRGAIAHAIDRQAILDRHFRSEVFKGKYHATANGLFPRASWANAPAPTVPTEMFHVEHARAFVQNLGKGTGPFHWTLKYPSEDAHVKAACEEMARSIEAVFAAGKIKADVQLQGQLWPELRKAIQDRDYDLLYTSADVLDDPVRLSLFFDRHEDATRAGGSNILGYDDDAKLTELLTAALKHRRFAAVQQYLQALHVHLYEKMPAIPLWHLELHVLALPSLTGPIDGREIFTHVRNWKLP